MVPIGLTGDVKVSLFCSSSGCYGRLNKDIVDSRGSYSKQMKKRATHGVPWDSELSQVPRITLESWFQLCVDIHVPWFLLSPHRTEEEFLSIRRLQSAAARALVTAPFLCSAPPLRPHICISVFGRCKSLL